MRAPSALGILGADGAWIGFIPDPEAPLLVVGRADGSRETMAAGPDEILSAAIAYFAELFPDPPQEVEATHADVADLVRSLISTEPEAERRRLMLEAVDAIDDGLGGDAVVGRLLAVRAWADPADAAERLRSAARSMLERPAGE